MNADSEIPSGALRGLLSRPGPPILIGVAGDSGSGKTTYINGLRRLLGRDIVGTISMDGYHQEDRHQRRISGRLPLDPQANRLDLLLEHLHAVKRGEAVDLPVYHHGSGTFRPDRRFEPQPIVVVEGLHALYPDFTPLLDFGIYVDPDPDIKRHWKLNRDLADRGYAEDELTEEMLSREAAYRRWIEFQKTDANVVIKVHRSHLGKLARDEYLGAMPEDCYYMELVIQPITAPLPRLRLPFNLASMLRDDPPPFMLAVVPRTYWGRRANAIHLDGVMTRRNVAALQRQIVRFTGIPLSRHHPLMRHERVSAIQFAQLLVTWPILEHVAQLLGARKG